MSDLDLSMYGMPNLNLGAAKGQQTPRAAAYGSVTNEDLEGLKWSNWATQNNFAGSNPVAQKDLVKQYYDNILPYVAGATGQDENFLKQSFNVKYPNESRLIGMELNEFDKRKVEGASQGMSGPELDYYVTHGKVQEAKSEKQDEYTTREEWATKLGLSESEKREFILNGKLSNSVMSDIDKKSQELTDIEEKLGITLTEEQKLGYLAGDKNSIVKNAPDPNEAKFAEATKQSAIDDLNDALRAADNVLGALDVTWNEKTQTFDDNAWTSVTSSTGPIPTAIGNIPLLGDAFKSMNTGQSEAVEYLNTLKASGVFTTLQKLRAASVDGSSGLGQIAKYEFEALATKIATLNPTGLKPAQLAEEVKYFKDRLERSLKLVEDGGVKLKPDAPSPYAPSPDAPSPDAPSPDAPSPDEPAPADFGELSPEEQQALDEALALSAGGSN